MFWFGGKTIEFCPKNHNVTPWLKAGPKTDVGLSPEVENAWCHFWSPESTLGAQSIAAVLGHQYSGERWIYTCFKVKTNVHNLKHKHFTRCFKLPCLFNTFHHMSILWIKFRYVGTMMLWSSCELFFSVLVFFPKPQPWVTLRWQPSGQQLLSFASQKRRELRLKTSHLMPRHRSLWWIQRSLLQKALSKAGKEGRSQLRKKVVRRWADQPM